MGSLLFGQRYLPLSEGSVLSMTTPVFAAIFSVFFLKESYDITMLLITLMSLMGVVFISKPTFLFSSDEIIDVDGTDRLIGTTSILFASVMGGMT